MFSYFCQLNVLSQIIVRKTLFNLITDEDFEYPYEIKASFKTFSLFEAIPDLDVHNVEIVMNQYCGKIPTALNKKNDSVNYAFSELCLDPLLKKPLVDNAVLKQHILAWHYCTQTVLDEYLQHALIEPIKDATIYEIGEKYAMLPNGINLYLQSEFFDYYKDELLDELNDRQELIHFLENQMSFKEGIDYRVVDTKNNNYVKLIGKSYKTDKSGKKTIQGINLQGRGFERFVDATSTKTNHKKLEDMTQEELQEILN